MGVYGALLTGVTGLQGQSTKMGAISDNIANVNTVGYKKADIPFQSLVTDPYARSTTYSPGGVLAKPRQLISQQGVISGTASATDFAISGRGMFIVSQETDASIDNARFYTRAGSFRAAIDPNDATAALLRNTAGFYLTGIPVTDRDNLPNPTALTQVETVNINRISNSARATEEAEIQARLPSELTQTGATITVFDADGARKAFTAADGLDPGTTAVTVGDIAVFKLDGTQIGFTTADYLPITAGLAKPDGSNPLVPADGTAIVNTAGADITFDAGGQTFTLTEGVDFNDVVSTVDDIIAAINGLAPIGGVDPTATRDADGAISVTAVDANGNAVSVSALAGLIQVQDNAAGANAEPVTGATGGYSLSPPATASLQAVVDGLNGFNETLRITTGGTGDAVAVPAAGFALTFEDGSDSLTFGDATNPTPSVLAATTVAELAAALNGQQVTSANGRAIDIQAIANGANLTIRATETVGGVTSQIALDPVSLDGADFTIAGNAPQVADDSGIDISAAIDANGFLSIAAFEGGQQVDIDVSTLDIAGVTAANTVVGSDGDFAEIFDGDLTLTQQVYDALGAEHSVSFDWRKRDDESNLWEVNLSDRGVTDFTGRYDPSSADSNGARFVVEDTGGNIVETQRLFLKFNGDGSLAEVRTTLDGAGGVAFGQRSSGGTTGVVANRETEIAEDPKLISVAIGQATIGANGEAIATPVADVRQGVNFTDNGAEAIVFEWNVGRPTDLPGAEAGTGLDGLTQFHSGEADPVIKQTFYAQNGARFGNLSGVQIDENGTLSALFDNGVVEPIYVIPIATFNNPNGLINTTGNIFAESPDSGQVQVKRAGENGAGDIMGSAIENSNVDLGDEFTDMIITQQSFTANTRTITTSDRMLEELVRILR